MSYYRVCPHCGANLDPDERCSCQDDTKSAMRDCKFTIYPQNGGRQAQHGKEHKIQQV